LAPQNDVRSHVGFRERNRLGDFMGTALEQAHAPKLRLELPPGWPRRGAPAWPAQARKKSFAALDM